ncbi:MAG: hypothetical protein Q4C71_05290, partial [Microbacteriaceae bacterium]|nr:hypothetical protein [Microbacteriaceae bacterium]
DESSKLGGFSKFATITELADTAETAPAEPLAAAIPPLAAPPTATQLRLLTELDHGESWLLQPRQLDETGLRWSAGIKLGVKPDSDFWLHLAGLPLIGVTHARRFSDLQDACNTIGSGAVASLHSWDAAEIIPWLGSTRAASLLTNQPTVPGQVERVPSGAWRASGCGIAQLAGGPNHLVALGNWQLREGTPSSTLHLRGLTPEVTRLIELAQPHLSYAEFDLLRRAALSDELAWRTELGVARDTSGLGIVTNILRYWRVPTHVRFAENTTAPAALRVLAAAMLLRAPISVSSGRKLGSEITALLASQNIAVVAENDETWLQNITLHGPRVADSEVERIRLVGGDAMRLSEWLAARRHVDIWAQPVTMAGPVELLTFLREQAVSINHLRHGTHADLPDLTEWLRQLAR